MRRTVGVDDSDGSHRSPGSTDWLRETTATLADQGPIALRLAKEAVNRGVELRLEQGVRFEQDLYARLQTTSGRAEGVRAFLTKRGPRFRGRKDWTDRTDPADRVSLAATAAAASRRTP